MQITPEDFDKAVSQPWSANTCLIAQADIRVNGSTDSDSRWRITQAYSVAESLMSRFDAAYAGNIYRSDLADIRSELPVEC